MEQRGNRRLARRTGVVVVCAALLVVGVTRLTGASAAPADAVNAGRPGALPNDAILRIARDFAESNGESDPATISAVATRHDKAVDAGMPGDSVDGREPVDLIAMTGSFGSGNTKGPKGSQTPGGNVLVLVIDASDGGVMDWSVGTHAPALDGLGEVVDLRD